MINLIMILSYKPTEKVISFVALIEYTTGSQVIDFSSGIEICLEFEISQPILL